MRWIRSNIRGLARLALVALALQITVTFAHVHLDGLTIAAANIAQASAAEQAVISPAKSADDRGPQSHGTADTDCPICALIQLASTSAPSVAPLLPIPAMVDGTVLQTHEAPSFTVSPIAAFQARGPPVV